MFGMIHDWRKVMKKIDMNGTSGQKSKAIEPEIVDGGTYSELVGAIGALLEKARTKIAITANTTQVDTYWRTGRYIVEYEQHGADRAKYGTKLLSHLTRDLTLKYGKGYGKSNLVYMRKLYRAFPKGMTVSYQLSWSHYLEILKCSDELEIGFYVAECARSNWNVRELRRQMKSSLFERIALSKDKKGVLALARKGNEIQQPEDILRDHYVLEFSGIKPQAHFKELTLHNALVEHMKRFMLELGKGFAFVASQYRIPLNTSNPCHVDLVFYNYFLKCFVLIDLKRDMVEYGDVGQMNMYLNYFKSEEGTPSDNPPIGIVLGTKKDDLVVQFATEGITNRIFISRYQLYLPDREQLRRELAIAIETEERTIVRRRKGKVAKR
jgi:predicted nuclease of restriction endonuclease-like (RecB) superfamily